MFSLDPLPQILETEIFARLPDSFRQARRSEWGYTNMEDRPLDSFLEGPAFDREGFLYLVDLPFGRIFRVSPAGEWELVIQYEGQPNGMKIRRDGQIFIADYKLGILELDPRTRTVKPFCTHFRLEPFKGCNDLIFHSDGTLYFTDQGQSGFQDPSGSVFCADANGRAERVLGGVPSPNGIAFSANERTLYLNVTRANAVWRLPIMHDGGVSKVGLFLQLSGGIGPDGLALDVQGNLMVCHFGRGALWQFNAQGELQTQIRSCAGLWTTNLAYGGTEGRTLYITEAETGSILRVELRHPGLPLYSHF